MKLVSIATLTPAAYNPRAVDPERLALVRLSLEKLGWLLPIYATAGGEIVSGHQRTRSKPRAPSGSRSRTGWKP